MSKRKLLDCLKQFPEAIESNGYEPAMDWTKGMFADLRCIVHLLSTIKDMDTDESIMYEKAKYFYTSGHYYRRLK